MMTVLLVTIDTNIIDEANLATLRAVLKGVAHEIAFVSVTGRERGIDIADVGSRLLETAVWDESVWDDSTWGGPLPGAFVIDESTLAADADNTSGFDVVVDDDAPLERILQIIGNGSFPPANRRENLRDGARRQLRDAMIFEAHIRAGRHLFVSNDERAFTRHGKRSLLELLGHTRILTLPELVELAESEGLSGLLPP